MKVLIVEDDYTSGVLMQKYLNEYGTSHTVLDGQAAVDAFRKAVEAGDSYDLICLDIMLPRMDGQDVLKQIRALEEEHGLLGKKAAKIIMTTALGDPQTIIKAFHEQCDGYLTKPIMKEKLLEEIAKLGLLEEDPSR